VGRGFLLYNKESDMALPSRKVLIVCLSHFKEMSASPDQNRANKGSVSGKTNQAVKINCN